MRRTTGAQTRLECSSSFVMIQSVYTLVYRWSRQAKLRRLHSRPVLGFFIADRVKHYGYFLVTIGSVRRSGLSAVPVRTLEMFSLYTRPAAGTSLSSLSGHSVDRASDRGLPQTVFRELFAPGLRSIFCMWCVSSETLHGMGSARRFAAWLQASIVGSLFSPFVLHSTSIRVVVLI